MKCPVYIPLSCGTCWFYDAVLAIWLLFDCCRVLSGLAVLNCLQRPLMQAAESRLFSMLRSGALDVQVCEQGADRELLILLLVKEY
jgi:hypothetical protein